MELTPDEAQALFEELIRDDHGPEVSENITGLVALRRVNTSQALELQQSREWPDFFYEHASPETRDRLIEQLAPKNSYLSGPLYRLAFIGDGTVVELFHEWRQSPPAWQIKSHPESSYYAEEAGWFLSKDGIRHELTFPGAVATKKTSSTRTGAQIGGRLDKQCSRCGANLVNALTLNATEPQFAFLGIGGIVHIPVCDWCVLDNDPATPTEKALTIWVHYELDGTSRIDVTGPAHHEVQPYVETMDATWTTDARPASPWHAFVGGSFAVPVIGGNPMWLQDAEYARCPDCSAPMRHLAWIPLECLASEPTEGIFYVQVCVHCQIATVLHQST